MGFKYRETVLVELARHGVVPRMDTPPQFVCDYLFALYSYEIRALKKRFKAGLIPQAEYRNHVEALRRRYPILSLDVRHWVEPE